MTGLAKPCMSIHPMASPTVCLVSIEVNSLTVTSDCSCLVIDRRGSSVNIVIGVVAVGFFFHLYDWHALQQNLAIASSSNFLCLFSNSRRSSDRTNKWPLRMTLMCDLDVSVLSYFEPWLCSCWTKHLQIFTECSLGYGHSSDAKYP